MSVASAKIESRDIFVLLFGSNNDVLEATLDTSDNRVTLLTCIWLLFLRAKGLQGDSPLAAQHQFWLARACPCSPAVKVVIPVGWQVGPRVFGFAHSRGQHRVPVEYQELLSRAHPNVVYLGAKQ